MLLSIIRQHLIGFVMDQDVAFGDAILADRHDFQFGQSGLHAQAFLAIISKDEWFSVLNVDLHFARD